MGNQSENKNKRTRADDVKSITGLALGDDDVAFIENLALQRVRDRRLVLRRQRAEQLHGIDELALACA